jgi:hypothetical protein
VGQFDESLTRGGEDIELAQRMRAAFLSAWYTPAAVVQHITPDYRLKEKYLIWVSQRAGDGFAYRDYLEWGITKTTLACIARIGQALLVNMPLLLWAYLIANHAEILGRKCLLWRAVAYTRKTLFLITPIIFRQDRYFTRLEFRKERQMFSKSIHFDGMVAI